MKLNKILKWCVAVLLVLSVALGVWGFIYGFNTNDAIAVDVMFYWAYAMVALALIAWVVVGGIIMAKNNPKSLIKTGIVLVGLAAVCFVVYLLSPGADAIGREGLDTADTLKLTDTVLNLTYVSAALAIVAIVVGEIRLAINNKK